MDGQAQVRLVFVGEVLEGHSLDEVKRMFGDLFKLEGDRLAAVFSGERTVLKRSMARPDGERYVERLRKIGMRVTMEAADGLPETQALAAAAAAALPANAEPTGAPPAPTTTAAAAAAMPSLMPLEEETTCPNCGERQPKKFVLCRKCNTDIPRALAAQKEDAERARAERLAARQQASGRFAPPKADVDGVWSGEEVDPPAMLSLSFEGRMGRASYVNTWGLAMVLVALVGILAAVLVPMLGRAGAFLMIPLGLAMIAFVVWGIRVSVLRLHDVNRSGWWVLLTLVPYLGAVVNLLLLLWPGTSEENDFGPKPRRGNVVLAIAIVASSVLALVAAISIGMSAYRGYTERAQQRASMQGQPPAESAEGQGQGPGPGQGQGQGQGDTTPRPPVQVPPGPAGQAFRDHYIDAPNEKAFAMSSAGAFGWSTGKGSTREAIAAALTDCEQRRDAYTSQCRLVNVNGLSPQER